MKRLGQGIYVNLAFDVNNEQDKSDFEALAEKFGLRNREVIFYLEDVPYVPSISEDLKGVLSELHKERVVSLESGAILDVLFCCYVMSDVKPQMR